MYISKSSTTGLVTAFSVLTLLAGCSSGGSSDDGTETPTNNTSVPSDNTDDDAPASNAGSPGAELVGQWRLCADEETLMVEYEFTNSNYTFTVGTGTCAGFNTESLVSVGSYTINGTVLSDSGLESYSLALDQESLNGEALPEQFRETEYLLAYTGVEDQLSFSDSSFEESELSLTLNLDTPFIRVR